MTKKTQNSTKNSFFRSFLPYFLTLIVIVGAVFVSSKNKSLISDSSLSLESLANNNFDTVTTDQLSEFYVVASLSDSMNLASTDAVSSNYVRVKVMDEAGQSSTTKLEKKVVTDTSHLNRCGVNSYPVANGDSMDSIAEKFKVTTDQIRWSNGLKTTDVSVGQTLLIPGTSGIVYKVKTGDSVDSLASKYGSNAEKIIACNDLEKDATLAEGTQIVLPDGSLPETERPEYVAPVVYTYSYSYIGNTSERKNLRVIQSGFGSYGGYGWGQCTSYAYWYRSVSGQSPLRAIPSSWGNARTWASYASSAGYVVNHTPEVGAVFQTTSGYYGHVGVVVGINADGSIVVREANYLYMTGRISESTIPASSVGNFNYIH
ncbi:LysM peptidoglycan-binding domain-containing protein [Candidatus Saccharibacteria bacterium]|nr:LysM peptidoglycan-binding domain-containing protein [Candidatus Saccharibacteria bacterium]